jgi:ZIP family zinc transporter
MSRLNLVARVTAGVAASAYAVLFSIAALPASADADEGGQTIGGPPVGMQPISGPVTPATPAPGESKSKARPDGTVEAIPVVSGKTKTFTIVGRYAPWTLKPGLTVLAKTYNGTVPGPTLVVNQGDRVVINYRNELDISDTIHLHGIHDIPVDMDGVPGSSQAMVPPHGHFTYSFTASAPGTFIYHTHDRKAVLDAGLYGGIIVEPTHPRPEEIVQADYLEMISSWYIQSSGESEFTLNGREYPSTKPIEVRAGEKVRVRWINISAENFHTMHTHGHYMTIIARDSIPQHNKDVEDTVEIGPGQRVDTTILADAKPGTWMVHCHVLDHIEDGSGMPDGLITAIHYAGTPNLEGAMYAAMMKDMGGSDTMSGGSPTQKGPAGALSFWQTAALGAFAGLTIFLGLPIARAKKLKPATVNILNAFAIGILVYLVIEISMNAIIPVNASLVLWHKGAQFPFASVLALAGGLVLGLVGLGATSMTVVKRTASKVADSPLVLAAIIAIGIGAHNLAEGLAIGASAASGATNIAAGLIIGFALHNATEGFGVAAPLAGKMIPSWAQIGLAGLVAGGPTFLGTMIGYTFQSPVLTIFFLATAIGALVFVIGELWSVLKKTGVTIGATSMVTAGFAVAFMTEMVVDLSGG